MKAEMKDSMQVVIANGGASSLMLTECNQILTLLSLTLAIAFTIYKFYKFKK